MAERQPRRLIEVDLPIGRISEQARREKSIRHGHISTLHIWWARRPLASCRAVILAGLLPDPADDACPQHFRDEAVAALATLPGKRPADDRLELQQRLLDFIASFSNWDLAAEPTHIAAARRLVAAAFPEGAPMVADPFAGGGAIPLEALRVGAYAWASDLNPVAVLLEKVVLEYIPRYGERLAEGVRRWGGWIGEQAKTELGAYYPEDPDGAVPIAYIWARTAVCEGPDCGARVPLMRGMWLAKKAGRNVTLKLSTRATEVNFSIERGVSASAVQAGTVKRGALTCPVCSHTTPVDRVRRQARSQGLPERLIAVVTTTPGAQGRSYRLPTEGDLAAVSAARADLERRKTENHNRLPLVPDEPLPPQGTLGFRIRAYGMTTWGDLFTSRQLLSLTTLAKLVRESRERIADEVADSGLADAITTCLALTLSKLADFGNSLTRWGNDDQGITALFSRQAIPMVWDFAESNPVNDASWGWGWALPWIEKVIAHGIAADLVSGFTVQASATASPLADASVAMVCTDPPYYDAVPYADLSDFFYVWLRRSLACVQPELLRTRLTPKVEEVVVNPAALVDRAAKLGPFFERQMGIAFSEGRRVLADDGIAIVVFAHKSTAGWEAILQALIGAGWTVTGSWPIDTEMANRLRARNSAALASSVHLVCRPRPVNAGTGEWSAILRELQPRVDTWMRRLAGEGIVGADAIFACLGPAIELYSRYDRVETVAGEVVPLAAHARSGVDYLSEVWAAVARAALRTIFDDAEAAGFETDSRLAAVWLWTLGAGGGSATGLGATDDADQIVDDGEDAPSGAKLSGFPLPYDTARKLAQPLGADLSEVARRPGSAFSVSGATARLVAVSDRRRFLFDSHGPSRPAGHSPRAQGELFLDASVGVSDYRVEAGLSTLDCLHQAMLLFADDQADALRRLLVEEGVGEDPRFWRLADALSKLYPGSSPEKRWLDGLLARRRMLNL